jgi:hypothetical protein
MARTIFDAIVPDVDSERRKQVQEDFGRHVVEQRNRMAALVRKWIESDAKFPIPVYDRLLDRIRRLDPTVRADIASISLLMADQIVSAVLGTLDGGSYARTNDAVVNYAVIAQLRTPDSDDVIEEVDVNRGKPTIPLWDYYKRWLGRYAPSELRPRATIREGPEDRREGPEDRTA